MDCKEFKLKFEMTEWTPSNELWNKLEALFDKYSGNVLWQHFIFINFC